MSAVFDNDSVRSLVGCFSPGMDALRLLTSEVSSSTLWVAESHMIYKSFLHHYVTHDITSHALEEALGTSMPHVRTYSALVEGVDRLFTKVGSGGMPATTYANILCRIQADFGRGGTRIRPYLGNSVDLYLSKVRGSPKISLNGWNIPWRDCIRTSVRPENYEDFFEAYSLSRRYCGLEPLENKYEFYNWSVKRRTPLSAASLFMQNRRVALI